MRMRVVLRTIIDYENCGDIENLKFSDKILVGIKKAWTEREKYKEKQDRLKALQEQAENERKEKLKEAILITLHENFSSTKFKKGERVIEIVLSVSREYESILADVLSSKEMLGYQIMVYTENPDMLLLYPNLPIQVRFIKKVLAYDEEI